MRCFSRGPYIVGRASSARLASIRSTMVKDAAATAAPTQGGTGISAKRPVTLYASYAALPVSPWRASAAHSPAAQNGTSLLHSSSPSPSASSALPLLDAADDLYDGKKVSPAALPPPHDTAAFAARLSASLAAWAAAGRRGVWLQLPASHAPFIPVALEQGFVFHHAEKVGCRNTQSRAFCSHV